MILQVTLVMCRAIVGLVWGIYIEDFITILCISDTMAFMIWKFGNSNV